ncbi:MAG: F420-nonreducing hydrogenase, partial [Candidatus Thorarchaeota archaeon]
MPLPVVFMQLSSCWGCHQSLLNAHFELLPILSELEIVYLSTIFDMKNDSLIEKDLGKIKVGFIEGVIRTEEDSAKVKLMRQKCDIIVAFGACACYGSIAGLANLYDIEELKERKFKEIESIVEDNVEEPVINLPKFEEFIYNVKDLIYVDLFIPGCPPKTENIIALLYFLIARLNYGHKSRDRNNSVCNKCDL